MGFLERAIRNGIRQGVGDAIGKAVQQAVEPTATELANKAADQIDRAAQNTAQHQRQTTSGLESAFSNLERAAQGYATEMSKNIKMCPGCGEAAKSTEKFCPKCGTKLPEQTIADGAVCTSCGKQNNIGTKFCSDCGAKLPSAIAEEQMAQAKNDAIMAEWELTLPQYPKWTCGGTGFVLEELSPGYMFCADFENHSAAQNAVRQYREVLQQNGFRTAGQYPNIENLYKMVDGVCYHVDTEHCFDGDSNCPTIYFDIREPSGGFYYVKPEPKKKTSFKDLFNL